MNAEILRGFTEAIILSELLKSDSYGYFISRSIIEKSNNLIDIKDATIYLAFKRMEDNKLIESYEGESVNGAKRKYYRITESGKLYYKDKLKEWDVIKSILDNLLH